MTERTYVAVYRRDKTDDAWNVHIKGLAGCQTYGRSLRQAQTRIREALSAWLDRQPERLSIQDQLPAALTAIANDVAKARREAERAGVRARDEATQGVRRLTQLGLSRRDAAELLGLSHQRVQQLFAAS
jgi:predicted RNase H-like HicB family nuclease